MFIYDVERSADGEDRSVTCAVSSLFYSSLSWYRKPLDGGDGFRLLGLDSLDDGIEKEDTATDFSFRTTLRFANYTNDFDGLYQCRGRPRPGLDEALVRLGITSHPAAKTVEIKGDPLRAPYLSHYSGSTINGTEKVSESYHHSITSHSDFY